MIDSSYLTAYINLDRIVHNCKILKGYSRAGKICVAVKADGYGHGTDIILPALRMAGVDFLATANIEEALLLRDFGWKGPVLIFGSEFSIYSADKKERLAELIVLNSFRLTAFFKEDLDILNRVARRLERKVYVHLQLDTGMSRMGLLEDEFYSLLDYCLGLKQIVVEGVYTHFASADIKNDEFTRYQLKRFKDAVDCIKNRYKLKGIIFHASNSAATIALPDAHFDMVRPGLAVYGYYSGNYMDRRPPLKPAMKIVSKIMFTKKIPEGSFVGYGCSYRTDRATVIGIVPIGYADGYMRAFSNNACMLIRGFKVPVIGKISMDQTIVDLTDVVNSGVDVGVGSELTVIDDDPASPNSVENLATLVGTIPYEIITSAGRRIRRVPVGDRCLPVNNDNNKMNKENDC